MAVRIIPFESGINTSYIIQDEGAVMFDAIPFKNPEDFTELLASHKLDPRDIDLIVMSHGDFDHVGGSLMLKELTGARIAIHEKDRAHLEEGIFHWPGGVTAWGKVSRFLFKPLLKRALSFPGVPADIVMDDSGMELSEFGIRGKVIHSPGHTPGSVSILLDSGDAFVGCLSHNRLPFVRRPSLPIYAMDLELVKKSWQSIINSGAKTIFPSHGKSFDISLILKYLN